jgi:transposase-like protein
MTRPKPTNYWKDPALADLRAVAAGSLSVAEVAARHGVSNGAIRSALYRARADDFAPPAEPLDVAPFREAAVRAVERGRTNWNQLARAIGMTDGTQLRRRLGVVPYSSNRRTRQTGRIYLSRTIDYDTACRLVQALSADPVDFGI